MYGRHWDILLVDDEPDVLAATRLALKGMKVYGLPLRLHEAGSAAEAEELLRTRLSRAVGGTGQVAVAFIDVVMETDEAGLELCRRIREELNDRTMQVYVRTGQPGVAPERSVIDRYEINGYTLKVDATPDRLYMLVKAGVRQHYAALMSRAYADALQVLIPASDSRPKLREALQGCAGRLQQDGQGRPLGGFELRACYLSEGQVVATLGEVEPEQALRRRAELAGRPGVELGAGDRYVVDGNELLVEIAAGPATSELSLLSWATAAPPDSWIQLLHGYLRSVAALWRKAIYTTLIRQDVEFSQW